MSKLANLNEYYRSTRQVGHSTFSLKGMSFDRPAIILCVNNMHAKHLFEQCIEVMKPQIKSVNRTDLRINDVMFRPISFLNGAHLGFNIPIILDHFALDVLYHEDREETLKKGFLLKKGFFT